MKAKLWQRALGALCVAAVLPASAATVTFEDVAPGLVGTGSSVTTGGMTLTQVGVGFGVVDSAAAFGPGTGLDLAVPMATIGQFYTSLNDGSVTMVSTNGKAFSIRGFDFGFVSALGGLFRPGELAGGLFVDYTTIDGVTDFVGFEALADGAGLFSMSTVSARALQDNLLTSVRFTFLSFDGTTLVNPNFNFNQFALDNIQVPEPTSVALAVLAIGLMGGMNARRSKTQAVRSSN
jgi:PEP-CTERM motif